MMLKHDRHNEERNRAFRRHSLREYAAQLHYRTPAKKNVDLTLEKVFNFADTQTLRFRTGFFNWFNHLSFANSPSVVGSAPITR